MKLSENDYSLIRFVAICLLFIFLALRGTANSEKKSRRVDFYTLKFLISVGSIFLLVLIYLLVKLIK